MVAINGNTSALGQLVTANCQPTRTSLGDLEQKGV